MKIKVWLVLAAACSLSLVATRGGADELQPGPKPEPANADQPPVSPSKSAKKKKPADTAKKAAPAPEVEKAPANAPEPAIVKQNNVNVRGQADIYSDVVIRLKKGDQVSILEEMTLKKPKVDEPDKWARIALPSSAYVWVHSSFIDAASQTVVPNKLNLRSGPGENYSILGRIPKGTVLKELDRKEDWIKIEAPPGSYAFVAAHLLTREPASTPTPAPTVALSEPPKTVPPPAIPEAARPVALVPLQPAAPVVVLPPSAPPRTVTPLVPLPPTAPVVVLPPPTVPQPAAPAPQPEVIFPEPTPVPATPTLELAAVKPAPAPPAPARIAPPAPAESAPTEETLIKRIVTREGVVKRSVSIQAPTYFVLESIANGKTINYLFSPSTNVALKDFRGQRIMVTGEELLDERWPNTPVINIDSLQPVP